MSRKWYNVTAIRKLNEEYHNDTGDELQLNLYGRRQVNEPGFYLITYDEENGHTLNPLASVIVNGYQYSSRRGGMSATIPAGCYYQICNDSGNKPQIVNEFRETDPFELVEEPGGEEPGPEDPEEPDDQSWRPSNPEPDTWYSHGDEWYYIPATKADLESIVDNYLTDVINQTPNAIIPITAGGETHDIPLNNVDVRLITNMNGMFQNANSFNQDISKWNVGNVTNMYQMFTNASSFNQDISKWNVGNVTNMSSMFYNANSFNQDISKWDVGNVTNISSMFYNATSFNQDISKWNVGNVTNMYQMFRNATSFNQDLSGWCVSKIGSKPSNFDASTTAWDKTNRQPIWGTCPNG